MKLLALVLFTILAATALNMKYASFEVSEHGNLLMYDRQYSTADVKHIIEKNRLNGLRILDFWDPLASLDFLRKFTFLKELSVTCRYDQAYSFLQDMPQLEDLDIGPSFPMENPIDLSHQVNLKSLSLQWRKNRITGLEACQNLEDLCVVEFKSKDLSVMSELREVTRLRIKTGSMKSLGGIGNLRKLQDLEVGNCSSLRSISDLNGLSDLRRVKIETCRKIEDYERLTDLPNLRVLQLINCGTVPALKYEAIFPNLEDLALLGNTKVKEPAS